MDGRRRRRGEHVVWRSRPEGAIGYVFAAVVVEDGDDATALFQPAGAPVRQRAGRRGGPGGRQMVPGGWDAGHEDDVFAGPSTVRMQPRGQEYAVLRPWLGDGYRAWYVNLEQPWVCTPVGFDSRDDVLDIAVADDLRSWSWKDEDELAWAVDVGKCTTDDADRVRRAGERVVAAIEARAWPFHEEAWDRWRPDPAWPIPSMPRNWDSPF